MSGMAAHGREGSAASPGSRAGSFDPRPLVENVDPQAVRAFAQHLRATGATRGTDARTVVSIIAMLFVGGIMLTFATTGVSIFFSIASASGAPVWVLVIGIAFVLLFVGGVATAVILLIVRSLRGGGARTKQYRLDRFARANGMGYVPHLPDPALPGMIFGIGSARHSLDLVRGTRPRFVEFANYRYTTSSGKNSTTHRWGYVAVKLNVPLPHIVLDALSNDGLFGSNLPMTFGKDQRLSLEGDFDRYFSLYCPSGYERDALYLFTPDIMVRFMDNAAALDVEIVDDWMFLYAKRDFSTLDPATWAWLFSVVSALLDKLAQWERWRDDRLAATVAALPAGAPVPATDAAVPFAAPAGMLRPPPGVAQPGRRLRRGVPWIAIIVIGIFVLTWLLGPTGFFGIFLGSLFGR